MIAIKPKRTYSTNPASVIDRLQNQYPGEWYVVGGLSAPSKMPCLGISTPASRCNVGSTLVKVKGSTCFKCYARKGRYIFKSNQRAMERRYQRLIEATQSADGIERWVTAMATLINEGGIPYFRWHDSGDIQSALHLAMICKVATLTPTVKHWIPSREYKLLSQFDGEIPANLCIRLSLPRIGEFPELPQSLARYAASGVIGKGQSLPDDATLCPAYKQGGKCGGCRECWENKIRLKVYPEH